MQLRKQGLKAKLVTFIFAILVAPFVKGEPMITDALVLSRVDVKATLASGSEIVPIALKSEECSFYGKALLRPETFTVSVQIERKLCGDMEVISEGFIISERGFLGLPVKCIDEYTNKVGTKICLSGYLPESIRAKVIEK